MDSELYELLVDLCSFLERHEDINVHGGPNEAMRLRRRVDVVIYREDEKKRRSEVGAS